MKNVLLKIGCLVVAILVWIQVAATTTVESELSLPLEVVGLADSLSVAGSELPASGRARLRAAKLSVMASKYLGMHLGTIALDLAGKTPGPPVVVRLDESDVRTEAVVLALLSPPRVPVRVDRLESRRLPVRPTLRGRLPGGLVLDGAVGLRPDSLAVRGPRRFFAGLDALATAPIDLGALDRAVTREVTLVTPPAPLELAADKVTVTIPVARLDERVVANVPVLVLEAGGPSPPGVSPPVCDVLVSGPADSVAAMRPERLLVSVPVGGLEPGTHQVRGQVAHPAWVTSVKLTPAVFTVIVGRMDEVRAGRDSTGGVQGPGW